MNDRYTKTVLTIIAVMLTVIAFERIDFPSKANAQIPPDDSLGSKNNPMHVVIEGTRKEYGIPVHITEFHSSEVDPLSSPPY